MLSAWITGNFRQFFIQYHDDVIKWKHFPRYWPHVRGIHRSPVDSPHIDQWRGALMFSLICAWTNVWANNRDASDLRRHRGHYDVTVLTIHDCRRCLRFDVPAFLLSPYRLILAMYFSVITHVLLRHVDNGTVSCLSQLVSVSDVTINTMDVKTRLNKRF